MAETKRQKFRRILDFLQKDTAHPYLKPLQGSNLSFKRLLARIGFFLILLVIIFAILEIFVPKPY